MLPGERMPSIRIGELESKFAARELAMHDLSAVVARVEKLERENRRLKIVGCAVVAILAAVALTGAVMPQEVPDEIRARRFVAVDESGAGRALITKNGFLSRDENGNSRTALTTIGLAYFDENGTTRAEIQAGSIRYFDENGAARIAIGSDGIFHADENRVIRAMMVKGGFIYADENEMQRALLGEAPPGLGLSVNVVLFDTEGNVIWQAPR